ncbi:MAG: hypothetical protein AAFP18_10695 [Bacteroidota bacterium]
MDSGKIEHVRCWVEISDETLTTLFQSTSLGQGGALRIAFDAHCFEEEFFALPVLRMWTHATIELTQSIDSVAFETYGSGTLWLQRTGARVLAHRDRPLRGRPEVGTGALVLSLSQLVTAILDAHRALARQAYRIIPEHAREAHRAWRAIQEERTQLKQAWQRVRARL